MNTSGSALAGMGILGLIIGAAVSIVIIAVVLLIWWAVIRSAVRRALRDHQEWLEQRGRY
jgi:Flp pilus assembly protein TadB